MSRSSDARAPGLRPLALAAALPLLAACRQDMYDQPRLEPLERSDFFADRLSARQPPKGTVLRGDPRLDRAFHSGIDASGGFVAQSPVALRREVLRRGQERFATFCSPCHSLVGDGNGMIVQRGYKRPPSFHIDRLRAQPLGYFVDVITNGFGVMPAYARQVPAADRWAIAGYVRALQLSQSAAVTELPGEDMEKVEATQ